MASSRSQKRSTLASSSGASTSSRTHKGAGLVRNRAKINATAVSACSPPESRVSEVSFLPGGCAMISSPASSGSSLSIISRCASPPLNRVRNKSRKWPSTASNAARSLTRPSRLRLPMDPRKRCVASVNSAISALFWSREASSSASSVSATRLTGPRRSRSIVRVSSRLDSVCASSTALAANPSFSGSTGGGHSKRSPETRPISTRRNS